MNIWVHLTSMNQNNWKSGASCERTPVAFKACAVVLSEGARRRSLAEASRRKYTGKYINWILWLKEKACWQVVKVYWKTRKSCREIKFFLKLIIINWQCTVPPQIDSTHARSYKTYLTHNSFSAAYYSTSVVLHEAVMYDTGNRSNTRRFCTAPNSTQTDSTRPRFNTTCFYTLLFLHKAGPAPPFPVSAHEHISGM